MKRFVFILALVLITFGGYAQTRKGTQTKSPQTKTATTQTNKKTADKKEPEKEKMRIGVTGGLGLHSYKEHHVALQAKLGADVHLPVLFEGMYFLGGGRVAYRTCGNQFTGRISNLYLEIPLRLGYTYDLSEKFAVFAEAGPYAGLTLAKIKHEMDHTGHYRPIDAGLGLDAGVQLHKKFRISLGFDFGFIAPCARDHACNGGIWLTGTYLF